jgi:hypothetical protein
MGHNSVGGFNLKDAIDLLYKQTAIINSLWTVYVAATFAAGGFSALAGEVKTKEWIAVALTIAFGAFTFGHWKMLRPELVARWTLREEINAALSKEEPDLRFGKSLHVLADTASKPYRGLIVHVSIDTCVIAAIWIRAFS